MPTLAPSPTKPVWGVFTNNQLKIIAMISMALDHIGLILFPQFRIFRILGRIAFPIFAYMIAEGCRYTKNRTKYLALIAAMGVAFQLVYFFMLGDLYQGILITFSLAIITIYSFEGLLSDKVGKRILSLLGLAFVVVFGTVFPVIFKDVGFAIDYDTWGILLPVIVYFMPGKAWKVGSLFVLLLARAIHYAVAGASVQWWTLLAIPFLALYNGKRGKAKMKYVFYVFYPAHLVILYGIQMLIAMIGNR